MPKPSTGVAGITGKYLSIMSFRRDGTGAVTPVWFVREGGRLLVMTGGRSGKVKRIRRDPRVTVAPCSARGRLRRAPIEARALILPVSEGARVKRLIARKYRIDLLFVRPIREIQLRRHPERRDDELFLAIEAPARG